MKTPKNPSRSYLMDYSRRERMSLRLLQLKARLTPLQDASRGDVPGWVLITLMSAILVAGLLAIAGPALEGLFDTAIKQVNPGGKAP